MRKPPLSEFIDLRNRQPKHGFPAMKRRVTVGVYQTKKGYQTLTIRIGDEIAEKMKLREGDRLVCLVHPDSQHLALMPAKDKTRRIGSTLFRPKGSRSLVFQTTLGGGTLEAQGAVEASIERIAGGGYMLSVV